MTKLIANNQKGFSLIELSIVLIIIGLLVGGVVGGSSLVKSAELRAVQKEFENFQVAFNTFRSTYDALPGDLRDRTLGMALGGAGGGNGNGKIESFQPTNDTANTQVSLESHAAFIHLASSNMIAGGNLRVNLADGTNCFPDQNAPESKKSGAAFTVDYDAVNTLQSLIDATVGAKARNILILGKQYADQTSCLGQALTAMDAYNIDNKYDDGNADLGIIWSDDGNDLTIPAFGCKNVDGTYDFTQTDEVCVMAQVIYQ